MGREQDTSPAGQPSTQPARSGHPRPSSSSASSPRRRGASGWGEVQYPSTAIEETDPLPPGGAVQACCRLPPNTQAGGTCSVSRTARGFNPSGRALASEGHLDDRTAFRYVTPRQPSLDNFEGRLGGAGVARGDHGRWPRNGADGYLQRLPENESAVGSDAAEWPPPRPLPELQAYVLVRLGLPLPGVVAPSAEVRSCHEEDGSRGRA